MAVRYWHAAAPRAANVCLLEARRPSVRVTLPASRGAHRIGRLKRRPDFLSAAASGKKWVSPTVIVQVRDNEGPENRIGFTTTRKLGGAVVRNRIRRRLKEAARLVMPPGGHHDIVLIGRPETETCDFAQLTKDLSWCLKRLDMLEGAPK